MSFLRRLTGVARHVLPDSAKESSPIDELARIVSETASLAKQGRYADAYDVVNSALEKAPADSALLFAKGSVLLDWGRYRESRQTYEDAQRNGLRSVRLSRHLGWACFHGGDLETAERHLREAVLLGPDDFDAQFCLGVVLQASKTSVDPSDFFAKAVALRPNDFQANLMLGNCRLDQGNPAAAEACYRRATLIDSAHASAWVNLGSALRHQDKLPEAITAFERAFECEKENDESETDAFLSVALGYSDAGRLADARHVLESNLERRPSIQAHCNYGALLLQQGWLQEGWRHFEFRWMLDENAFERPAYGKPVWNGQNLDGKTVLIRAEQGIGDTIQFLRYASLLKARGARVLLKAPSGLEQLGRNVSGLDGVLPAHETPLDFDYYVHSLSIARPFGTALGTIPASVPYVSVDPERKSRWQERLGDSAKLKVGLVWAGSPEHKRDRYRSMALDLCAPLFDVRGVRFVSLQKGPVLSQIEAFAHRNDLLNLGPELDDLADTAAVIDQLDLVVGVDTAVIHLAGAMGRPVWTLIATPSDWRWLIDRDDCPWYPTMRLFRQDTSGDWVTVVDRVRTELAELVRTPTGRRSAKESSPDAGSPSVPSLKPTPSLASNLSTVSETRYGIIQYFPQPLAIAKSLELYGEYLQLQIEMLRRLVTVKDTILEFAAGCGAHVIALATICHNVIAYEADPKMRRVLRQNVRANKLRNVTVLPADPAQRGKSLTTPPTAALTVDALALSQLGLIKVNDDSLLDTIRGAEGTLWRLRPSVFAIASDSNRIAFREQLATFGYRCWHLETPLFNGENFNRRRENVFGNQAARAMFAIPEELDIEVPPSCDGIW
jgi:tetratricopeptide (TPR) repeat protein